MNKDLVPVNQSPSPRMHSPLPAGDPQASERCLLRVRPLFFFFRLSPPLASEVLDERNEG